MNEPHELPNKITPAALPDVAAALSKAWAALLDETPSQESILVLLAQWTLETGGGHAMHCFNLGNAKSVPGDGRSWCFFRCNEIIGGKAVWFDPPHPQTRFRAFGSLEEGAADYLELLHRRFASAWPAVVAGDPAAFGHDLKAAHYYTADEHAYTALLVRLMGRLRAAIPAPAPCTPPTEPSEL
jgi:flagellum-specific peptidoglycan hydrolase FlgJ